MAYKNKGLLNVYFSYGAPQSLLVCKVLVWGTTLLLVSHAPVHTCIFQTIRAARQSSHLAFKQILVGTSRKIYFYLPLDRNYIYYRNYRLIFGGLDWLTSPVLKGGGCNSWVTVLIIRALPQRPASLTNWLSYWKPLWRKTICRGPTSMCGSSTGH